MDAKTLKKLADQFDELGALMVAISGTFRSGEGGDADDGGDGAAEKPVRGSRSRAKPAASKAKAEATSDLTEDDLREKLKELAGAKGKEKVAEALAEVGAGRLAEVDEGDYQALADAVDKLMAAKAARTSRAKAKPAGPTFDDVKEKFTELVETDKAKAKAVLKEAGIAKLSEADADDEGAMQDLMTAIEEALAEDDDLV